jgi:hypothetical protein
VNLLVPTCISASHAAFGSVRMEPVFMMLGHAAGAAASLAVEANSTVQEVPYPQLRDRLLEQKQILEYERPKPAATSSAGATDGDKLKQSLRQLVDRKLIASADYWQANAVKGKRCDGEKVGELLVTLATLFKSAKNPGEAVRILAAERILSSPEFWEEHAVPGQNLPGDYVATVIHKSVSKAKP